MAICLSLVFSDRIYGAIGSRLFHQWMIVQPLLFYLVIFACLILLKRQPRVVLSLVILMCLGNVVGMRTNLNQRTIIPSELSLDQNQCHSGRDGYLSVIDTFNDLWDFGWSRTHIWWDEGESIPVSNCSVPTVGFGLIGQSVVWAGIRNMKNYEPCPPIKNISAAYFQGIAQRNEVVSVITNNPSTANNMLVKLRTYGNYMLAKQSTVIQGDIHFLVYVYSLDGKIR